MFRCILIFYLLINVILFIKFDQFEYQAQYEDVKMLSKLPNKIYETKFIQSLNNFTIKKPKEKSWNKKLLPDLTQARFINYGTSLNFTLSEKKNYCVKTNKLVKISSMHQNYFELSSYYRKYYGSNRGLPQNNCFTNLEQTKIFVNFDVLNKNNFLKINDKYIDIKFNDTITVNPMNLFYTFIFIIFMFNYLLIFKNNKK